MYVAVKGGEQAAHRGQFFVRRMEGRQPCRHALESGPNMNHLDDFAHVVDAGIRCGIHFHDVGMAGLDDAD